MAYCGAPTTSGGYCRNPAGSCPHHGWSRPAALPVSSFPVAPAGSPTARPETGAENHRIAPALGATAGACLAWILFAWLVSRVMMNGDRPAPLSILVVAVLIIAPFGAASRLWARCGAWRVNMVARCTQPRPGLGRRCSQHGGVTLNDVLGLIAGATGIVMLLMLPGLVPAG